MTAEKVYVLYARDKEPLIIYGGVENKGGPEIVIGQKIGGLEITEEYIW